MYIFDIVDYTISLYLLMYIFDIVDLVLFGIIDTNQECFAMKYCYKKKLLISFYFKFTKKIDLLVII